jgi:outer membrane receptor protein involved in Fe transport
MRVKFGGAALLVLLTASAAYAQDGQSNEIIVTAQKREQSAQSISVAVSVFSGQELVEQGVTNINGLEHLAPSLEVESQFGSGQPSFSLRGVGFKDYATLNAPTVGVYVDEVANPYPVMTQGVLFDLERVEVLRGPQGTLYGRNSIGGTINVISKRPSDEFEGEARLGYNEYGRTTLEGLVSGPFSDSVRGSLQVFKADQDEGYYENRFPNMPDEGGVVDIWYAEGQLAFEVTDRFDARMRLRVGAYDNRDRNSAMISPYDAGYSLENVPTPTWDLGPGQLNIPNPGLTDNSAFLSDRARSNYLDDYVLFITELNYRFDTFDVKYIGGYQQAETGYSVDGEQGPSCGFDWPLSNDWYNYALFP